MTMKPIQFRQVRHLYMHMYISIMSVKQSLLLVLILQLLDEFLDALLVIAILVSQGQLLLVSVWGVPHALHCFVVHVQAEGNTSDTDRKVI
jgi:hypothetical protein